MEKKEGSPSKSSGDPAIDNDTIKYINPNKVDHVGALLKMLSVNDNLPPKQKKIQTPIISNENKANNSEKKSTPSNRSSRPSNKSKKSNVRTKEEKKTLSVNTKSTQPKKKRERTQTKVPPKNMKMNPITHSYVWPPPLPNAPKTEYDDVYKWPCYLSSPKAAVVTGL